MSKQFFPSLSKNYIEILNDDEYSDINIEVGKDTNMKIFRAHMVILCYRSPFLRTALASNKKNVDNGLFKLPNISPEIFWIILTYIYGGIIPLNEQEPSEILKILSAADALHLKELADDLQEYLIEDKCEWMERHFELTHRTSFQSNSLSRLQKFCTDLMAKSPKKVFKSFDFTSLPEKSLVQLIRRDDLQMKEVEIWEYVLKWGLEKNHTLLPDPKTWSDNDFQRMKNTLQHYLPSIRFFSLSSDELVQKIDPYKKLLGDQLYDELINSHMSSNSKPNDNILLPRYRNIDGIIDSTIVNLNIVSLVSRWIDKKDTINSNFSFTREFYLPYKFKLLLRGSRDGFTPKKFHKLCDDKLCTVTFIKIKGTEEIIGGYNPSVWKSAGNYGKAKDSFIFSFKNKDNFKDPILSYVKDYDQALYYNSNHGPTFDDDLDIYAKSGNNNMNSSNKKYNFIRCKQQSYEKKIRDTEDKFSIKDYEVFQILI
ncbi:hypothetical protein RirG_215220 [Rhizophagus irregularis DAOM 197198w]|uniref:Kelch-like protein 17 n=2 Tax=Rhizophagus irregularis TaxID=588596 RepID=A0A015LP56_RHIIW|nr:hypothetical protein RirG_215220 [Rhizophagus irregularis DAOM 197198w]